MGGALNDVFSGKEPVPPSEAADMVKCLHVEEHGLWVLHGILGDVELSRFSSDMGKELAVGHGTVCTELMQDLSQGGVWHGDLAEVVKEWDLLTEEKRGH